MKCCVCGLPYEPGDRTINYFSFFDNETFEIKTTDHIDIEGRTAALCPNCTRAAAFGIVSTRKNKRFEAYKPLLWAPMFEEDQILSV